MIKNIKSVIAFAAIVLSCVVLLNAAQYYGMSANTRSFLAAHFTWDNTTKQLSINPALLATLQPANANLTNLAAAAGITTTWTNVIGGVITQRITAVNGIIRTNLAL